MKESKIDYWIYLVDKLNTDIDLNITGSDILKDLCNYLDFASGFIYQADHKSLFKLTNYYSIYEPHGLKNDIDIYTVFSKEMIDIIANAKYIYFRGDKPKDTLSLMLSELFNTNSMLLVPVLDQNDNFSAMIGIMDRRGQTRNNDENVKFTYSILRTLANHIKLQIYQNRIQLTQKALDSIINNMGVDIYVNDFHTHEILYVNDSMAKPYGGVDKMMGEICWNILYDDKTGPCDYCPQKKIIDDDGNPTKIYSWDYKRPFDGSWFRVLSAAFKWVDGRLAHIVSSIDITESKKNEELVKRMAEYDYLTGLPNRHKLSIDCDNLIPKIKDIHSDIFIFFFDLDDFKNVNDTYGHRIGDDLLYTIGNELNQNPLIHNNCYRYGGDEFVIMCRDFGFADIMKVVDFLMYIFSKKWDLGGHTITCGTSIGISHFPDDDVQTSELIRNADKAMYFSKKQGTNLVHFYNSGDYCTPEEYKTRNSLL